jgi:transcriptional regulator with XRE-family HTH domain
MSDFAVLLTAYRRRADLSMYQLAHACRVDPSHISRLESGQRNPPQADILRALMDALALDGHERQQFALLAAGARDTAHTVDAVWHEATMRAANAIIAACPCSHCTVQRAALAHTA